MSSSLSDPYNASIYLAATTFVPGISLGVMSSLYSVCMYNLVYNLRSTKATRKKTMLAIWISLLWTSSSTSTIANAYCTISAYIWKMDYPGGPNTYLDEEWNKPVPILAYTTYLLTMWLADGLMLWRLFVCYHGVRPLIRGLILSFAFLIYIGAVGTACFTMTILGSNQTLFSKYAMKVAIPCFTLSVTLNVFITAIIAIRLLRFRSLMAKTLGHEEAQESPYTSVVAMLTESSALYTIWSLVFITLYAVNSPVQNVLLMTLCNVQVIAPVMIVYRASKGTSWERETCAKLTSKPLLFAKLEVTSDTCSSEQQEVLTSHIKGEL